VKGKTEFSRVYATYSGIFIAMSLLWAWYVDGLEPEMEYQPRAALSLKFDKFG
jgi:drug/metabolite transporter superfamily protein YnfA